MAARLDKSSRSAFSFCCFSPRLRTFTLLAGLTGPEVPFTGPLFLRLWLRAQCIMRERPRKNLVEDGWVAEGSWKKPLRNGTVP